MIKNYSQNVVSHDLQAIFIAQVSLYNDTDGLHLTVRKSELILAKYTYEAKAPLCASLPILSRCQVERTQVLYPDTTVANKDEIFYLFFYREMQQSCFKFRRFARG